MGNGCIFRLPEGFLGGRLHWKWRAAHIVADTANATFSGFGNAAINNYGQLAFSATREDGSQGVFIAARVEDQAADDAKPKRLWTIRAVTDPQSPLFTDPLAEFGDPVINEAGLVADVGFFSDHPEIFTGNTRRVTARTDPDGSLFISSEHPSVNNRGVVAFFANELSGRDGVFVELSGGASPIGVIETGDALFWFDRNGPRSRQVRAERPRSVGIPLRSAGRALGCGDPFSEAEMTHNEVYALRRVHGIG